jgi:L-ascorbate metabolism protein UlaG (beta-lactamase superfamily)
MQLTWLGHSAFHLDIAGKSVLIDPFWTGNPKFPEGFESRLSRVDFIVLTHGHEDHLGDSARLAQKYGATVVAMFEICVYLGTQGVSQVEPMNIGGTIRRDGSPSRWSTPSTAPRSSRTACRSRWVIRRAS